jgi:hypothetical protein
MSCRFDIASHSTGIVIIIITITIIIFVSSVRHYVSLAGFVATAANSRLPTLWLYQSGTVLHFGIPHTINTCQW